MSFKHLVLASLITFGFTSQVLASTPKVILTKDNTVLFNKEFTSESVAKLTQSISDMDSNSPSKEPIYLILNTPGGEVNAGIELIENLRNMNRPIRTITLFAASMGFQTVQGLGSRLILESGTLMAHKARGQFSGEFPGQLDSRYGYFLKRIKNLDKKAVSRTKGKHTMKSFETLIENEYWCDGQDCVAQGLADQVVRASCDKSLSGTREENQNFSFMGVPITVQLVMSNCPLVTGALDEKIFVAGESLFPKPGTPLSKTVERLDAQQIEQIQSLAKTWTNSRPTKTEIKRY